MEQLIIRNLPVGTKAALKALASQSDRSMEAEARDILATVLKSAPPTIVDLLSVDFGSDFEFEPERIVLTARTPEL